MKSDIYDVVIAGGGPAGTAAAVAAGRSGAKTLLIEQSSSLGGMGTLGLVPFLAPYSYKKNPLLGGIAVEVLERLAEAGGTDKASWAYIDPIILKYVYDQMVCKAGVEVLFLTSLIDVRTKGNNVEEFIIHNKSGISSVRAKNFIDCTGDADAAAIAGCEMHKGDKDGLMQAVSACFAVGGIDAEKFLSGKKYNRNPGGNTVYCTEIFDEYTKYGIAKGLINNSKDFTFHVPGAVMDCKSGIIRFNFAHMYNIDGTDAASLSRAIFLGRKKILEYFEFLKGIAPGFENAVIIADVTLPNIRESRRLSGRYVMKKEAFYEGRTHKDDIAIYDYYIDLHETKGDKFEGFDNMEAIEKLWQTSIDKFYGIPFSCMLPKEFDNLAVAGRSVSADRAMLGALRVMPACMALGQAAGTAAAITASQAKPICQTPVVELQKKLQEDGVIINAQDAGLVN